VVEDLSKITAIDPPPVDPASNEVLGLALGRIAETLSEVLAARNFDHSNRSPVRTT
jgi:hypothetical protein